MEDNSYTSVHSEEETLKIENSGKKIVKETKYRLLEMVFMDDYLIKDAAQIIGLNYSTAKSIVKRFREKKSFKKKLIKLSQKQNKITHQEFSFKAEGENGGNVNLLKNQLKSLSAHLLSNMKVLDEDLKYYCSLLQMINNLEQEIKAKINCPST